MSDVRTPPVTTPRASIPTSPAERTRFWRDLLTEFAASGLSVGEFSRRHGVSEKRFYNWRRQLGLGPAARPSVTTTPSPTTTPEPAAFVPVRVTPEPTAELVLPSGIILRLPLAIDPQQLARFVRALTVTSC